MNGSGGDAEVMDVPAAQRSKGIGNVLLIAALMMGLTFPFIWAYALTNSEFFDTPAALWPVLLLCIGMAGAGAIGVRVAHLSWQQTLLASLLAGAVYMLLTGFEIPPFYPGLAGSFELVPFLIGILFISSPVFLLPLFDPAMRRTVPAPSIWKVTVTALLIMVPFLMFDLAGISYTDADAGQVGRTIGTLVSYILLLIGVIVGLRLPTDARGPKLGSIGILLRLFFMILWPLLGLEGSL
jgi:hypothetical protein